jgi:N-acetylmuramoyl-L-alanine amidase
MMKLKFLTGSFCLLLLMLLLPTLAAGAEAPLSIKLFMNDKQLKPDVSPQLIKGNTLVPVRIIAEELGAIVGWDDKERKVTVRKDDLNIELQIDNPYAYVKGKKEELEVAPIIVNGSTLLPVRFIGEKLGTLFSWDGLTQSVHMFRPELVDTNPALPGKLPDTDVKPTPPVTSVSPKPSAQPSSSPKPSSSPSTSVKPKPTGSPTATATTKPTGSPSSSASSKPTGSPSTTPTPGGTKGDGVNNNPEDKQVSLVQSIELTATDLIVKTKDGEIKPSVFKLSDPNRIVFDLPYTTLDESLVKQLVGNTGVLPSKHPLVEKIRFSNYANEPATVRIILDMKEKADYKIAASDKANVLKASIQIAKYKIVIDAGHGDGDPGAPSVSGKEEKEFTLSMAKKLNELLSKDKSIEVLMTRNDDTFLELNDRVAIANNEQADLFLSIHGNSFKPDIRGVETYYSRDDSIEFANIIHKHALKSTGFPDRKVRQNDFRVIKNTTMPAVLLEVGYLSNKTDEASMFKESFQDQVAAALVNAIYEYLNNN